MSSQSVSESPIKTVIKNLLLKHGDDEVKKDEIMIEIIKFQRLDKNNAEMFWQAMLKLGLGTCVEIPGTNPQIPIAKFSMVRFALMRNYLTEIEIKNILKQQKLVRGRLR